MKEGKKAEILVDMREERSLIAGMLKERGAEVKTSILPVGDFILSERVGVERKRRADFESSVIDGRLFKQAQALAQTFEKPIMVIEGERFEERISKAAFLGAVSALILDFDINVFFTKDPEATAELLYAIAKREQLTEKKPIRLLGEKRAFTTAQKQQLIVEALPGVGPKLAKALLRKFRSVEKLMRASEERLRKVEGIGKKKARAIRELLAAEFREE